MLNIHVVFESLSPPGIDHNMVGFYKVAAVFESDIDLQPS